MRSPIRWAGSKKALLSVLKCYWSNDNVRYVEPFCGSACLFFALDARKAILGDINRELIASYRAIKKDPKSVARAFQRIAPTKASFLELRELDPFSLPQAKIAARFLFLNRFAFNGIYRTNLHGKFNVPYAVPKQSKGLDIKNLLDVSRKLQSAKLINGDFEKVLEQVVPGDFVYLDPPYAVSKRRVFREYHPDSFSGEDIARLRQWLIDFDRRGIRFVVSYADSSEGRELTKGFYTRRISTRRNIAGFIGARRKAYEILASNFEVAYGN